jgi:hypothetical protein
MVLTKLKLIALHRNVIAIGSCSLVSLIFVAWVVYVNFLAPVQVKSVYRPVPTVTPKDYYDFLVNPEDYYAGKCLIVSQFAAPEAYEAHPGIKQCEFKRSGK